MLTYVQKTGALIGPDGRVLGVGYAGAGPGKNNPAMQAAHNVGPLPCGDYVMSAPVNTTEHGPYVLWLIPNAANVMYGRSGFGLHGDSIAHSGEASEGCIVQDRDVREEAWTIAQASNDYRLRVVAALRATSDTAPATSATDRTS